jgi:hypothetical protein
MLATVGSRTATGERSIWRAERGLAGEGSVGRNPGEAVRKRSRFL